MSLYAIGDFHLSFTVNKPMDVFDKKVTERDTVVITGGSFLGAESGGVSGGSGFYYGVAGQEDFASWKS